MKPVVFNYLDYREYLRDYCRHEKETNRAFSHRYFANRSGLASPAHISLVIQGKRNLSQKSLDKFVLGLGLKGREKGYFGALVLFNQSKASQERDRWLETLMGIRKKLKLRHLSFSEQNSFYGQWFYTLVYEMIHLKDFQPSGDWISKKLSGLISSQQGNEALNQLKKMNLVSVDPNQGKWSVSEAPVFSSDQVENLLVRNFHRKMIGVAGDHVDDPMDDREICALTIASYPVDFDRIKQRIKEFVNDLNGEFSTKGEKTDLYQMNVQLFKLSSSKKLGPS